MKIIHTSDWHLGQKLLHRDRAEEHQLALDWLRDLIREEEADALLVAGDIFDIGNPPNYARRMYYDFLISLEGTTCRHIVITGGNHDSPSMLEAPAELLARLNVHVRGAARDDLAEELIPLHNEAGDLEAVVAAVPFLRDRDLRTSVAGETGLQRIERIREGLRQHYRQVGELAKEQYGKTGVPLIAMGHLYASGADVSGKQDNIYIGDKENIMVQHFPDCFDYVALGHIHRQQAIGGVKHIRYSGSLIPLSFSETKDDKGALVLAFSNRELVSVTPRLLPVFRRLKTIQGTLPDVEKAIERFVARGGRGLEPWLEILVEGDDVPPRLDLYIQELVEEMPLEVLKIRLIRDRGKQGGASEAPPELEDLAVEEVFARRCAVAGLREADQKVMQDTFRELMNWQQEQDEQA